MKAVILFLTLLFISCDTSSPIEGGTASPNFAKENQLSGNIGEESAQVILYENSDSTIEENSKTDESPLFYSNNTSTRAIDTATSDIEGNFTFDSVHNGIYSLGVTSKDSSRVYYKQNIVFTASTGLILDPITLETPGSLHIAIDETDSIIKEGFTKGDIFITLKSTHYKSSLLGNGYVLFEGLSEGKYLAQLHVNDDGDDMIIIEKEVMVTSGKLLYYNMSKQIPTEQLLPLSQSVSNSSFDEIEETATKNKKTVLLLEPISEGVMATIHVVKILKESGNDSLFFPLIITESNDLFLPLNYEQIPAVDGLKIHISYVIDERVYGFDAIAAKGEYIKVYEGSIIDIDGNLITFEDYVK